MQGASKRDPALPWAWGRLGLAAVTEAFVAEYRRGIHLGVWQKFWHFKEECRDYPRNSFAIGHDKPSDDKLCSHCLALAKGR